MLQVGITGGMGAGKSLIIQMFELFGIPTYDSDAAAKTLMVSDEELVADIRGLLGNRAYDLTGQLDRAYIGSKIFSDDNLKAALEALVHPAVHADAHQWHQNQKDVPYTLREAALLFESGSYLQLDAIINVSAPEDVRIQRVMARDRLTVEEVRARLKHQWSEYRREQLADFTIINDGEHSLIPQLWNLHSTISTFGRDKED